MKLFTLRKAGVCPAVFGILAGLLAGCGAGLPGSIDKTQPAAQADCPSRIDATRFDSSEKLWAAHQYLDSLKARPTGSPSHKAFVDYIDAQLGQIPGLERRESVYTINHWLESSASLEAGAAPVQAIPVSGSVPYSHATPAQGVSAPLVYVPQDVDLSTVDIAGKIVLREAQTGSLPQAVFLALAWWVYDPTQTLLLSTLNNYERDFLGYDARLTDIRNAGAGGAAGLILMHGFPREQMLGHYAPYEGERFAVPAVYVGVDEGEQLKQMAAAGQSARIRIAADEGPVETRSLFATLPGVSAERIVIESHTDGTNVHEDNGPLVILAMARYFASLPQECRPKTLEFAFPTAHFYQQLFPPQRHGGSGQYAQELDYDYDKGDVVMSLVLEHLGTLSFDAVERGNGLPGRELKLNGKPETISVFVNDSPLLVASMLTTVVTHDMRGAIALRGADLPGAHIPLHHSLGGEGTPYNEHLIPTVAYITSPWALYNPAFGLEVIDQDLLYRQTLMFTDFVHLVAPMSRYLIAGGLLAEREARSSLCAAGNPGNTVTCEHTPAESN